MGAPDTNRLCSYTFCLVLVALAAITRITLRQRKELRKFAEQPDDIDDEGRLVTHYGVWWKIYPDAQYMEDFPYIRKRSSNVL
jgi:hypothetical protein